MIYLYVTNSGIVNLIEGDKMPKFPSGPNLWGGVNQDDIDHFEQSKRDYESAIIAAEKYPISDQDSARQLIITHHGHPLDKECPKIGIAYGPFDIGYEIKGVCCSPISPNIIHQGCCDTCDRYKEVAILLPEKEPKVEQGPSIKVMGQGFHINKPPRKFEPVGKLEEKEEVSPRVAKLLLQIRDELAKFEQCPEEAYHLLYQIASPNFDKKKPWAELEKIAAGA